MYPVDFSRIGKNKGADSLQTPGARIDTSGVSVDARNRIYIAIPCQEKNPEQKILFYNGENFISVFEVGKKLGNFLEKPWILMDFH